MLKEWQFILEDVTPALLKVSGVRSVECYSGAGALRADLSVLAEMENASDYERPLVDAAARKLLGCLYGAWNLKTAGQAFRREVTPELIRALSSRG